MEQRPPRDDEDEIQAQLSRYPRLSTAEERRLLATHGTDRDEANRVLIEHNLHLVLEAAQARKGRGVAFGDLFQEGTVGLISAVEHYKPADGGFHARLVHVVAVTMDDVLAQTDEAQRNDEAFVIACRLLESAQRLLSERLDRPATPADLAKPLQRQGATAPAIPALVGGAQTGHAHQPPAFPADSDEHDHP